MKNEEGVVRSISNGKAVVEINNISSEECARCGVCVSAGDTTRLLEVKPVPGLEAGDKVVLKIDTPSLYKGASLLFFFPVVSFIIGCMVATKMDFILPAAENARMGLTGLLFFLTPLGLAALYDRKTKKNRLPPEILSINSNHHDVTKDRYAEGY